MTIHWLGYAGTVLVILAYLPQVRHLLHEHCSAGLSVRAYLMWGAASALLLSYAISLGDRVHRVAGLPAHGDGADLSLHQALRTQCLQSARWKMTVYAETTRADQRRCRAFSAIAAVSRCGQVSAFRSGAIRDTSFDFRAVAL